MLRNAYQIFSKGRIANLTLKNRLVRSATHEALMTTDGKATDSIVTLYKNLAEGGVGMIITGSANIMPEGRCNGRLFPKEICLYDDVFIPEIAKIAEAVHGLGNGCRVLVQLNHVGRQVLYDNTYADPVGPSNVPSPILIKKARTLTSDEIQYIVQCFAKAATRAKRAECDGVQLHAAHGYLLSSFLSPYTNCRDDHYGGSIKNRVNIIREIISRAREEVGDFPILIKMNCDDFVEGGIDIDIFPETADEIQKAGVDAIEISGGMLDCLSRNEEDLGFFPMPLPEARTRIKESEKQSYFLKYVEALNLDIPVILVGGHRNIERMENIMEAGRVDYLALSRPLISEPDLPNRWLQGRGSAGADCISCNSCLWAAKSGSLECVFKRSKQQYKIAKDVITYKWKTILK